MNESNSIETLANTHLNAIPLSDQTKFRLNEINKIKDYFNSEIRERKIMSKKLNKYIAAFDYIDKTLIVLSATSVIGIKYSCIFSNYRNNTETVKDNKKEKEKT